VADGDAEPDGQFHDELELLGWLILRGGLPAREFAALKPGNERTLLIAGIKRAEQRRIRELAELARLMGGDANGS
jgi:hypothetical protein